MDFNWISPSAFPSAAVIAYSPFAFLSMFFFTRWDNLTASALPSWTKCARFGIKKPSCAYCSLNWSGSTFRILRRYSSKVGCLGNLRALISLVQKGCLRKCSQEIRFTGSFSSRRPSKSAKRGLVFGIGSKGLVCISVINCYRPLALNGGKPVAISYITHPKAQISD